MSSVELKEVKIAVVREARRRLGLLVEPLGFRRSDLTWTRRTEDTLHQVQIKRLGEIGERSVCFTVEIGIAFGELGHSTVGWPKRTPDISRRVPQLAAQGTIHRYQILNATDRLEMEAVLSRMSTEFALYGIPFINSHATVATYQGWLESKGYFDTSLKIATTLGDVGHIAEIFSRALVSFQEWLPSADLKFKARGYRDIISASILAGFEIPTEIRASAEELLSLASNSSETTSLMSILNEIAEGLAHQGPFQS
jgi:hypothetical protein